MRVEEEKRLHVEEAAKEFMKTHGSSPSDITVFTQLLHKLLSEDAHINWNKWRELRPTLQKSLSELPTPSTDELPTLLDRLVVIRLNGGLGTTMGCSGPKSIIEVRNGLSFLEIALKQHEHFCQQSGVNVPLLLMNSFRTHEDTVARVGKRAECFVQSKCPRLYEDTLLPVEEGDESWYPPGHGNLVVALHESGLLHSLLQQGKDIIFVSNIDNTGAEPSSEIAKLMADESLEYVMECTQKTAVDLKGGTLIEINNRVMHLEMPQVPPAHLDDFCSTKYFSIFNTNNIWLNLNAVKDRPYEITAEIIVNKKKTSSGSGVIQLETSIGGAIRNFEKAFCVHVPRSRFIPVKGTADLLAVSSDLYSLDSSYCLRLESATLPTVHLSPHFSTVSDLHRRFPVVPSMRKLRHLSVKGDISFAGSVTFEGEVCLAAEQPVEVAASAHYKDQTVLLR